MIPSGYVVVVDLGERDDLVVDDHGDVMPRLVAAADPGRLLGDAANASVPSAFRPTITSGAPVSGSVACRTVERSISASVSAGSAITA